MIYLIATLVAFLGGLLGRALTRGCTYHGIPAFLLPACLSTGLMLIPFLFDVFDCRVPFLDFEALTTWANFQFGMFLVASFLTGIGWLCSYCIQAMFED